MIAAQPTQLRMGGPGQTEAEAPALVRGMVFRFHALYDRRISTLLQVREGMD